MWGFRIDLGRVAIGGPIALLLVLALASAGPGAAAPLYKDLQTTVKDFEKTDGLFPLFRDPKTGATFLALSTEQLGADFIHYAYTENGIVDAGHNRGLFRANQILRFKRYFNRVEIWAPNLFYYFEPESALARSAGANTADALLAAQEIIAQSADGKTVLINADFLLTEALAQVRPSDDPKARPGEKFTLGRLTPSKTRFADIRNYPSKTDFIVDYTFDQPYPQHWGGEEVWDARAVTIRLQHSIIAAPTGGFVPRIDDFRVGYFAERRTDMTSVSSTPYRDLIQRWNLKKADETAEISEPVKKITFWIENTTPEEYRETVKAGVLAWNAAFEKAGFKDAIEVLQQPDDADWDAGDIRYNVIRWTASPDPPFAGYGPRFTDPRTGEIIGADIVIEFDYVVGRILRERIFEEELPTAFTAHRSFEGCAEGDLARRNLQMGLAVLAADGAGTEEKRRLVHQALKRLIAHEVGHTLGLSHNMKGSSIRAFAELHNRGTFAKPLTGSVMDYMPINLSLVRAAQGKYYQAEPGPYDEWAIEAGYRPFTDDPEADKAALQPLLARSTEADLAFGNDADDMRDSRRGIDPRVMVYDLSDDPVAWARERIALADQVLPTLKEKLASEGESYQALRQAYFVVTGEMLSASIVASRQVGGVYVERALQGQMGAKTPFTPVPLARQEAALDLLADLVFAPDAFEHSEELLRHLQLQRRGYDFRSAGEDPRLHARALLIQTSALDHFVHPRVLARLSDSALYGETLTPTGLLLRLNQDIAGADWIGEVNAFRRNLQIAYAERLAGVLVDDHEDDDFDPIAKGAARAALEDLDRIAGDALWRLTESPETRAHRRHLSAIIAAALD